MTTSSNDLNQALEPEQNSNIPIQKLSSNNQTPSYVSNHTLHKDLSI